MTTALIIIDIQNDYFPDGRMEVVGANSAALNAKSLLEEFRNNNKPIVHVQHLSLREGSTFFLPGTTGVEIHKHVIPLDHEKHIIKHYPNSFRDTQLEEYLLDNGIKKIIFCGMMSHMCIDTTVRAAFDKGFSCIVADDACATRQLTHSGVDVPSSFVHAAYMAALGAVFAEILSTEQIIKQFSS